MYKTLRGEKRQRKRLSALESVLDVAGPDKIRSARAVGSASYRLLILRALKALVTIAALWLVVQEFLDQHAPSFLGVVYRESEEQDVELYAIYKVGSEGRPTNQSEIHSVLSQQHFAETLA